MSDEEAKINRIADFVTNVIVNSTGDASLRGQALNIFKRTKKRIKELKNVMTTKDFNDADISISEILESRTKKLNDNNPRSLQNSPIPSPDDIENSLIRKLTDEFIDNEIENRGGRRRKRKTSVPKRYVPKQLSKKDKKKQAKELKKSRQAYKKGKYYTRKKMKSFKNKVSPHIIKARKMYKVDKITPNKKLAKACGCKIQGLRKIVKKGQGAYFSSGSRPNQTGHSWGYARMASAITGGKASAVDYNILEKYCTKKSKALKLAKKMRGKGTRRVKQVKIGGRRRTRKY
tara:strand:- start:5586 stop:6452 length:867 start_codon:yes stop_codon:yes gene_type:complete